MATTSTNSMRNARFMKVLIIGLVVVSGMQLFAQPAKEINTLFRRDLEIMEVVLDRLLAQEGVRTWSLGHVATSATRLPDFGVIFRAPQSGSFFYFNIQSGGQSLSYQSNFSAGSDTEVVEAELLQFLTDWTTPLVPYLSDEDRIAIYRAGSPEMAFSFHLPDQSSSMQTPERKSTLIWVGKNDLLALRSGKIAPSDFQGRIRHASAATSDAGIQELAGTLENALPGETQNTEGVYVEGYGALLFTEASFSDLWLDEWLEQQGPAERGDGHEFEAYSVMLKKFEEAVQDRRVRWRKEYQNYKRRLVEVIGEHGSRINVKPQDWVVIRADLLNPPAGEPRQLVCRVKKQDLQNFQTNKLSKQELLKRFAYFEN